MAAQKNVKFQGSVLAVATAKAATKTITDITKANPAVVTSTAHGYANGDPVYIAAVVGMTEVNGRWFIASDVTANTFELTGVDSTGYTTYVSGGTAQAATFVSWCEPSSWNAQSGQAAEIDTTTICSTAKEYETGLVDYGSVSVDFNFAPKTSIQTFLAAAQLSAETVPMRLTLPNSAGVYTYLMGITQLSYSGQVDDKWQGSGTFRIKEAPHFA